ncbi:MAG: ATP-binding protein [Treponema sp.]|nr:ATP-binding protein [Treponema sp.]
MNYLWLIQASSNTLTAEQTHALFQLIDGRYESGAMIMTSNKTFGKWTEFMNNDEAVATASLDRLLHHCHIISLQADSYRMKDRMKVGAVGFCIPRSKKDIGALKKGHSELKRGQLKNCQI